MTKVSRSGCSILLPAKSIGRDTVGRQSLLQDRIRVPNTWAEIIRERALARILPVFEASCLHSRSDPSWLDTVCLYCGPARERLSLWTSCEMRRACFETEHKQMQYVMSDPIHERPMALRLGSLCRLIAKAIAREEHGITTWRGTTLSDG